jgi:hypothetical protein
MCMIRTLLIVICSILLCVNAYGACPADNYESCGAGCYTACDCSYAKVSATITAAPAESTINVPAGSCTWATTLSISKGIKLIGAGIGNTNITSSQVPVINYSPTSANAANNYAFRVSGFTFNLNGNGQGIYLSSGNSTTLQTKIRIDHNRFYNSTFSEGGQAIENEGMRGVIDNNTMENLTYPMQVGWGDKGNGNFWWQNFPELNYGTSENMYVEDNTFTGVSTCWENADTGGRYAFRYNTATVGDMYPLFDLHGPGSGAGRSAFGAEVYGNQINAGSHDVDLMNQRGGRILVFYNNKTQTGGAWYIQVEHDGNYVYSGECVNNSYYFNNRKNLTGSLATADILKNTSNCSLAENAQFWQDSASFNGTSGVGCGTLANRPSSCTKGVGYWATNQSCTNLTGMVGANPSAPISGTLYKCTSTNTWTAYYTPYTYPHPLREAVPNPPVLSVQ